MASIAALSLREAILPLATTISTDSLVMTKVEHNWSETVNSVNRERTSKMYLPTCDDPSKKELFFYVIDQFLDAMSNDRLHLSTGPARYSKFRQVLNGTLRLSWQTLSTARANKTVDSFLDDLRDLIGQYFAPTARSDQLEYLRTAMKPYDMSVEALAARLRVISRLGRLLPGGWNPTSTQFEPLISASNVSTDLEYKRTLFSMVPMAWRVKFAETAHDLDNANYTYAALTRYLSLQEAIEKRNRKRPRDSGGRGHSHGGRGGGRGGRGGRGRGRGRIQYGGGRGYGYSSPGRGGYSYGRFGQGGQYTGGSNPYVAAAQGGRFQPGRGRGYQSPGGRGTFSPGRGGRAITNSPRPQPYNPPRRGPPPQFPQFMADSRHNEHYHQEDGYEQEHYYEGGEEHYYGGEYYEETGEHYYEQPDPSYAYAQEHYYEAGGAAHAQEPEYHEEGKQEEEETHFLGDFGY